MHMFMPVLGGSFKPPLYVLEKGRNNKSHREIMTKSEMKLL